MRGIGAEYHSTGINPTHSQERFAEAHDLIVRAWTEPGPFRYAGQHYQFHYVNLWPRPYQTPHPPIWIPSQGSGSTIQLGGEDALHLLPDAEPDRGGGALLPDVSRRGRQGRLPGLARPARLVEHRSMSPRPTRKAMREAKPHLEALANRFLKMPTEMLLPPGYTDTDSMKRMRAVKVTGKTASIEDLVESGVVIVGSPATVREKLAEYQDLAGFNTSLTKTQFGTMPNEMARANMRRSPRKSCRISATAAATRREGRGRMSRQSLRITCLCRHGRESFRPSTSCLADRSKVVDARNKCGRDEVELGAAVISAPHK